MGQKNVPDEIDAKILDALQADGRRPYAELGTVAGISGPSAHERVRKLEARGIIRGYSAVLDPAAVGYGVLAFTWLTQAPGTATTDLTDAFAAMPEVEECHHIAGEADYLVKVRARDMLHLERIIKTLQGTPSVFTTETSIVLSSAFERRPLALSTETDESTGT
jgi:Lrp/AsnC family leucine-responsive transcriptional regulator